MSFVDNEIFDNLVVGEYRDNDGHLIKGVYTTQDDGALVVGIDVFERLLYKSGVDTMSLEEAEKTYGEEIIRRHYEQKEKKDPKAVHSSNAEKAREVRVSKAKADKALMLKLILRGTTKEEIMETQGFSRTKVERFIKSMNEGVVSNLFEEFKHTVFDNPTEARGYIVDFKMCHCSYKEYQAMLRGKKAAIEEKERKEQERADKSYEAMMERIAGAGYKPSNSRTVKAQTDKNGEVIADIDTIASIFSGVDDTPVSQPECTDDNIKDANFYIDNMKRLQKDYERRESILPTRKPVYEINEVEEYSEL